MEAVQYKCPNCGGELTFRPENQKFGCEYCFSEFTEEEVRTANSRNENRPVDEELEAQQRDFQEHTNVYHCGSCGAEIIAEENESATFCYYCHEPVILSGRLTGDYKPKRIIGFQIDRNTAESMFKKWCWSKWFIPKDFKTQSQLEKMTGLYVPFWLADCDIKANLNGIGKKIRTWSSGNYRYTETTEYEVIRKANISMNGIPADGESKIEDKLMEAIEPFRYTEAKNFSMSYLSGFYADKYDVEKAQVFPRIRERAENGSSKLISESIQGYSTVIKSSECYNIVNTEWEYMLLPVWFMTYIHNGKTYSFALNGQTGKIAGTPPFDKLKCGLFCGIAGLIVTIISMFGGYLFS